MGEPLPTGELVSSKASSQTVRERQTEAGEGREEGRGGRREREGERREERDRKGGLGSGTALSPVPHCTQVPLCFPWLWP